VIDAGVRDTVQLQEIGLPIFARGACIRGTGKDPAGVGSLNLPREVGGVLVNPGDLVVGDEDGVVILPRADVPEILSASVARLQKETDIITRLQGGERTIELLGLDALLGGGAHA
jgi:4-hydroxy-4-methyl-2-oxoglutarate aldolase